jgi:hypothetical protein
LGYAPSDAEHLHLVFSHFIARQTCPSHSNIFLCRSESTYQLTIRDKSVLKPPVRLEVALQQLSTEIRSWSSAL